VLENVVPEDDRSVDFMDTMMTENTRGAYPIEFIRSAKIPCIAGHPTDIISLTCDAFGILPPVSSLSSVFRRTLSCLASKQVRGAFSGEMQQHQSRVWLVNTGWGGGSYGVGERISLRNTRAIIDAIHTGVLASAPTRRDPVVGLNVATECPGVASDILPAKPGQIRRTMTRLRRNSQVCSVRTSGNMNQM
jgi:phosphoenolpyruvate carboxykinase (ATP)